MDLSPENAVSRAAAHREICFMTFFTSFRDGTALILLIFKGMQDFW
jgi:hypothetical protein